jgi:hypothetical protein
MLKQNNLQLDFLRKSKKQNKYTYHRIDQIKHVIKSMSIDYNERPIYGVYFICCMGNYLQIIKEQLNILLHFGLFDKTTKLLCFICNYQANDEKLHDIFKPLQSKIQLITTEKNLYEKFAINNFKLHIPDEKYYLYYFHTKGVSRIEKHITMRRYVLNFYTLRKYEISLKLLKYYDVVGMTLFKYPKLHFSGNFWWSKSENINTLSDINDKYLSPEMYICSNPNSKCVALSHDREVFELMKPTNHLFLSNEHIIRNMNENIIENQWGLNVLHLC